ncbi:mucoidy inhibitor MuiA family protein [Saccharicrinis sp. FJH54]|uniref:mucoidy inhibitor MuiA family protein n=1 Tax=Saccharicrinis sp. FJH54 TaxID=3344665 RepID=UPI0035D43273
MKYFILLLSVSMLLIPVSAQDTQELKIDSKVNDVTVFLDGAQVTRKKTVDVPTGITNIVFVNLSPYIDSKSIQVKVKGKVMVQSVSQQRNYMNNKPDLAEAEKLHAEILELRKELKLGQTYLTITRKELDFLNDNRIISGRNNELSITNLKETSAFYGERLKALKLKEIKQEDDINQLEKKIQQLENQRNQLSDNHGFPTGEIVIKIESKTNSKSEFELSYLVTNAGWFPSYDIRAKNISEPVEIVYKANVHQDTKVDWENVKIRFSSSDPNVSGVMPTLNPYYISYNYRPLNYGRIISEVSGYIYDNKGEPLPGASVSVEGTTIGTVADINGHYSLMLPAGSNRLKISFIGYSSKTVDANQPLINIALNESAQELGEVSFKDVEATSISDALQGRIAGLDISRSRNKKNIADKESIAVPFVQTENQTTVEFEISVPYSLKSDKKTYAVEMVDYSLPANYQYFCIPKVDKDAFLLANITDWSKYNFLEGEANIFFEETYIGKTILDVRNAGDTLQVSLGRDKNVVVQRELLKDKTSRQFIGTKKEVSRAWEINVKNNKSQKISMVILDQVPVSKNEEIEIEIKDLSGAKMNNDTGELKWEFELNPAKERTFDLNYLVKYPKSRTLYIE